MKRYNAGAKASDNAKNLNQWSRKDLLSLPERAWGDISQYDSVLILGTRRKHDSGWGIMAIIGVIDHVPVEIACQCCDDIAWSGSMFRTDCAFRSGALHAWRRGSKFVVGYATSSIEIEIR